MSTVPLFMAVSRGEQSDATPRIVEAAPPAPLASLLRQEQRSGGIPSTLLCGHYRRHLSWKTLSLVFETWFLIAQTILELVGGFFVVVVC